MTKKQRQLAIIIFVQALLATIGSLYFSNFGDPVENLKLGVFLIPGFGYEPCQLCWWARILMYPIVIISLVGILKKDKNFINYVIPLAIPGFFLEAYHYLLQKTTISNPFGCTGANPCSALSVNYLGFITIPFLCWVAFTVILVAAYFYKKSSK